MVTVLPGGERLYSEGLVSLPSSLPRITSTWVQPLWVVEGTTLHLTCQGERFERLTWLLPSGEEAASRADQGELLLQVENIGVEGEGKYTCVAANTDGSVEKVVDVEVLLPTSILPREKPEQRITLG